MGAVYTGVLVLGGFNVLPYIHIDVPSKYMLLTGTRCSGTIYCGVPEYTICSITRYSVVKKLDKESTANPVPLPPKTRMTKI